MSVSDFMSSPVIIAYPTDNLAYVRNLMLKKGVSRLVVIERNHPIGMITRKDIIRKLRSHDFQQRDFDSILVSEIMRSPIISINENSSIIEAAKEMLNENIRGLPVVNNKGELVGIITKTDITRYFAENIESKYTVKSICQTNNIPIVNRHHSVYRVIDILEKSNNDRVIVVDGGKPVGIITETDLSFITLPKKVESFIKRIKKEYGEVSYERIYLIPIAEDIMTLDPITIKEDEDANLAAKMLIEYNIGGMPVINDDNRLTGVITKFDFVKALAKGG
ncbi:MAG: CBS domain-containing protein [Candidatus Methanomethylicia archaeon]|nr:CBS domain-containing protein [Candidatus Methanomethylicia archaeon]